MKTLKKLVFTFMLVVSVIMTNVPVATAYAAQTFTPIEQVEERVSASSTIYQNGGSFTNGYWGDSATAPTSGNYKIYYCIKGATSTSDSYTFALNGKSVISEKATGTSRVVTKYYSAGSTISFGIYGTYGRAYAYSILITNA